MISKSMAKYVCESLRKIDIRFLKREGYLELNVWRSGIIIWSSRGTETGRANVTVDSPNSSLNISYYYSDPWTEPMYVNESITLTSTPCHFGGVRYWIKCGCGRRIGILYAGAAKFACRRCYDLAYYSQQDCTPRMFSALRKAWKDEGWLENEYANMRVKFWKGRPTKRYRNWLARLRCYEALSSDASEQLDTLIRCLDGTKKVK